MKKEEAFALYELESFLAERAVPPLQLIKGQFPGPLSLYALAKVEFQRKLELAELISLVERQLAWQLSVLSRVADHVVLFSDEPFFFELEEMSDEEKLLIYECYSYLAARLSDAGAFLGLHPCGYFNDILFELPFDIFLLDCVRHPFRDLFSPARLHRWREFLLRGSMVVPGILQPNASFPMQELMSEAEVRLARFEDDIDRALVSEEDNYSLWSSCRGHGSDDPDFVEQLYEKPLLVNESSFFGKKLCNW